MMLLDIEMLPRADEEGYRLAEEPLRDCSLQSTTVNGQAGTQENTKIGQCERRHEMHVRMSHVHRQIGTLATPVILETPETNVIDLIPEAMPHLRQWTPDGWLVVCPWLMSM